MKWGTHHDRFVRFPGIRFLAIATSSLGIVAFGVSCSSSDTAATPDATSEAAADSTTTTDASDAGSAQFACELDDLKDVQRSSSPSCRAIHQRRHRVEPSRQAATS
jgi:hypothetical protein